MQNIVITGMSGAGKTQAVQILEDLGFFCVDNLPPQLIQTFLNLCRQSASGIEKVALVSDIRGEIFKDPNSSEEEYKLIRNEAQFFFLDARDEVLVSRYQESRRSHPLSQITGTLMEAIEQERDSLDYLKKHADVIIDTSDLSVSDLKKRLYKHLNQEDNEIMPKVNIYSFGFKYASPMGADYVFDVRFLPNPYYKQELRQKTGLDKEVRDYVLSFEEAPAFYEKLKEMMIYVIPQFKKVSKNTIEIAIGCTGGQHRSVTFAYLLANDLEKEGFDVALRHRDIYKNRKMAEEIKLT